MSKSDISQTGRSTRRNFLEAVGLGAAGVVGGGALARTAGAVGLPGHLPQDTERIDAWLRDVAHQATSRGTTSGGYRESVAQFAELLDSDGIVRMYVTEMIDQVPEEHKTIHNVTELLRALDHIVQTAPAYDADPAKRNTFPVSTLFVYMMYTPAGIAGFTNRALNGALRVILKEWCAFLDSAASRSVLNTGPHGWLSPSAVKLNKLDEFVIPDKNAPHWGFKSFNDYFHRQVRPDLRPVDSADDPKVIVSANDGTVFQIERDAKESDRFWTKSQPYSLVHILDNHPAAASFVGGDVMQSFLSGDNYHRWRAPIGGTIVEARIVNGLMFSELHQQGFDQTGGTYSQGYEASVNTRGLVLIDSGDPTLGTVCVVPIGITEISSISIQVEVGQTVKKGEELGYFSYGGSSMCLIFQPGAVQRFTVKAPAAGGDPDGGPPIKVNAQIAVAN